MKKRIVAVITALVIVICSVLAMAGCTSSKTDSEYILDKGALVCGITLYEPMNYADEDGEMTGFDTEFAEAVCAKLGIEAKFQVIKWSSKEIELNGKYIDCIWNGFTVNEERKQNVDFSQSYLNNTQCVVIKSDDAGKFTSAEACKELKGTAEAGSAGETEAQKLSSNYTAKDSQMSALTDVLSGNSDFAVVDVILANSICGKGDYAKLEISGAITLESEEYAIGFRKGSDMPEKVNAVINELLADGTLERIAEKYGLSGQLIKN
ncbi:MAG: transporter substrate-binding domain-containing protein [Clostridia bacterium]|nr:transporter substrate-binding domain-containing protein [Clostridia bacterium]